MDKEHLLIKTTSGQIYEIPNSWNFINLYSNDDYEIFISAELSTNEFNSDKLIYIKNKYIKESDINFPVSLRKKKFYKKFRIQYKNEFIELCAETFQILKRSIIASHIRVISIKDFTQLESGIFSNKYNLHYPIHQSTIQVKISVACLINILFISDLQTDVRTHLEINHYLELKNCSGAIFENDINNYLENIIFN
jgi:hypothetical protein